jgi:hypothetical protein
MKRRKRSLPEREPKALEVEAPLPAGPPTELPARYGRTRVTLMEVDPFHLYAYWEVTPKDKARALEALPGTATSWALRFHDVGWAFGPSFDVAIDLPSASWYVEVWADEKSYAVEIGPQDARGNFVAVVRSNIVRTARATPSLRDAPRWGKVEAALPCDEAKPLPRKARRLQPGRRPIPRGPARDAGALIAPSTFGVSSGLSWGWPDGI